MSSAAARRAATQERQRKARSGAQNKKRSILDRLGPQTSGGTRIAIKNVAASVSAVEIRELCASVGAVSEVSMKALGAAGSSQTYEVDFRSAIKAREAVLRFDGRTLDGRALVVAFSGGRGAARPVVVDLEKKKAPPKKAAKPVVVRLGAAPKAAKKKGGRKARAAPKARGRGPRLEMQAAGRMLSAALK